MRKRLISVIGAGAATADELKSAEEVGREIARCGAVLVCGGLGGVMEAACKGAKGEGGFTVGILPGEDGDRGNPYLDIALATGLGEARNILVARASDGVIAVGGALGTLSELAFAIKKRLPVAAIASWRLDKDRLPADVVFAEAASAKEAVDFVMERIEGGRA
ncbi:MAG: TIGR00725 family protein [Planctomycetota bacterium]